MESLQENLRRMTESNSFDLSYLDEFFQGRGYLKKGSLWWKANNDLVLAFSLQNSRWVSAFYVVVGIFLGSSFSHTSNIERADITRRLRKSDTSDLFDGEKDQKEILMLLQREVELLEAVGTQEALSNHISQSRRGYVLTQEAKQVLGIQSDQIVF